MIKKTRITSSFLLGPLIAAAALFTLFTYGCRPAGTDGEGEVKFLYTSEVGGHLDPCG